MSGLVTDYFQNKRVTITLNNVKEDAYEGVLIDYVTNEGAVIRDSNRSIQTRFIPESLIHDIFLKEKKSLSKEEVLENDEEDEYEEDDEESYVE
jgi:hypothetical protein